LSGTREQLRLNRGKELQRRNMDGLPASSTVTTLKKTVCWNEGETSESEKCLKGYKSVRESASARVSVVMPNKSIPSLRDW